MRKIGLLALVLSSLALAPTADAQPTPPAKPALPTAAQPTPARAPGAIATGDAFTDGAAALNASDYAAAEKSLAEVKGPKEAEAKVLLARAALEQGKYADAERLAQAKTPEAIVVRGQALAAQGKVQDAIALVTPLKSQKGGAARLGKVLLGEWLIATGKRADADDPLHKVIDDYNDDTITKTDAVGLAQAARAAHLLRHRKDANQLFKEAEHASKDQVQELLWFGELFVDGYDPGDAETVVREALKIAPHRADLIVLLARIKLEETLDFDEAEKLLKEALAVNPKHTGALAVKAGLALRDMDIQGTEKAIAEGLAVNPNDLELLSMRAAARFLDDDPKGFEAAKKQVLSKNPQFSRMFAIIGEYAEWEHRYDDIVAMMKEAVKIDPDDAKARAELGLTELRGGDETNGLSDIQSAYKKDKFNVRVYNTLNLYEDQLPTQYDLVQDGVFKVRYANDERAVMERYVPRMLGEAWASMKSRYGFVPTVPVQVEMYASREQFSVRTSGLPNIGIQGVCFGRVVAAISPKAEPFNWGNVLWHELGHVFAIQLSKNHVPRWFTEGLSEYETIARRPEWARELDPELYRALVDKKLPSAVDMNRAFTHADDANDVTVAYYAASQMLIWTVEQFGMPKVRRALELWGEGKRTPEVLKGAFGVTPDEYDAGYRKWQLARLSRYEHQYLFTLKPKPLEDAKKDVERTPNDPTAHVRLALAILRGGGKKGSADEANKELAAALAIDPQNADAHYVKAQLALRSKDIEGGRSELEAMQKAGKNGYVIEQLLAEIADEQKDVPWMRYHLESAHRLDPSQPEPLKGLFDLAKQENREADQLDILRQLAALEQHDHKVWRMLLEKLVDGKQWAEARKVGESAVFVDILGGQTHVLYAKALSAEGAHEQAAFELDSALLCNMKDKEKAAAHVLMAQELVALKRPGDAKKHVDVALKLDPENAEAKAIKIP